MFEKIAQELVGFDAKIVGFSEKALRETGETGLIEAVEWIAAHQKDSDTNPPKPAQTQLPEEESSIVEFAEEEEPSKPSSTEVPQAMSFKCDVYAYLKIFSIR